MHDPPGEVRRREFLLPTRSYPPGPRSVHDHYKASAPLHAPPVACSLPNERAMSRLRVKSGQPVVSRLAATLPTGSEGTTACRWLIDDGGGLATGLYARRR